MIGLCECGHVEDEHDMKRHRFGPCGVAGCGCERYEEVDQIDDQQDEPDGSTLGMNQADGIPIF